MHRVPAELFATLSHELRTPLAALLLWEGVLRDGRASDELKARALDAIHESAMLELRLIDDLTDLARVGIRAVPVEMRTVDVAPLLDAAIAEVTHETLARGIDMVHAPRANALVMHGNAPRLRHALDALLAHAVGRAGAGGRIVIASRVEGTQLTIEIMDSGCLLETGAHDRVGLDGRHGLRVVLARELVALHGGSLAASSPEFGSGATFTVMLPARVRPPRSRRRSS